jgi:hypothetical protein
VSGTGSGVGGSPASGGAAPGVGAGGVDPGTGGTAPWYQSVTGADAEIIGHMQNKGWHNMTPAEAALAAARSHREAERTMGMRSDHDLLPIPKDPTKGDMTPVWERLGKPKLATDYDFSQVKFKDGTALDETFTNFMRDRAFQLNLPKNAAADMARGLVEYMDQADAAEAQTVQDALAVERANLERNWGSNFAANKLVAQNAVRALGIDPETVNALENVIGYSKVMEMFRTVGSKIGEDVFITGGGTGNGNNNVMSQAQAAERKAELRNDPEFVRRFLANDVDARRQMTAIDTILTAVQRA